MRTSINRFSLCRLTRLFVLFFFFFSFHQRTAASSPVKSVPTHRVYIFLAETCPICQYSTVELRRLYADFGSHGFEFIGIMPNYELSSESTVSKFSTKYSIPFPLKIDQHGKLTASLKATITPEVVVVRISDQSVVYRGRIDNSFERVGKRRKVVTEHYLRSAFEHIRQGLPPIPASTQPVGCLIAHHTN